MVNQLTGRLRDGVEKGTGELRGPDQRTRAIRFPRYQARSNLSGAKNLPRP